MVPPKEILHFQKKLRLSAYAAREKCPSKNYDIKQGCSVEMNYITGGYE